MNLKKDTEFRPIKKIGLIAGNGKFPVLFARAAKAQGIDVIAAGIRGDTSFVLKFLAHKISWFKAGELKSLFAYFKNHGIQHVIMAGQVSPKNLFHPAVQLDQEFQKLFTALNDRKADTIFSAVAEKLRECGMDLLDSTFLLQDYMAPKGTLTRRGPSVAELEDMAFGKNIAKSMGGLDVGQTVVVKDKAIVAIEAMEGTDQCIVRGGKIAKSGAVVVKMSKPEQDLRFDIPVIGPRTIRHMITSRCGCLAVEAAKTLVIDLPKCVKLANQSRICIVGDSGSL